MAQAFFLSRMKGSPPLTRAATPSITDNVPPPPVNRAIQVGLALASWVFVATPLFATASVQNGPVVQPPIVRIHHEIARQSWDTISIAYQPPKRAIPTQQADAPPPSSDINLTTLLRSWDPIPVPYQPPRNAIPTQRIDNPPPSSRVTDLILARTWDEPTSSPIWKNVGLQDGPTISIPLLTFPNDINLQIILRSWEPPAPFIPRTRSIPAQQIDNPPPSSKITNLISARTWDPPVVSPVWTAISVQDGPAVSQASQPPPNTRPWLSSVIASWDASNPIRPRSPVVTASGPQVIVQNPPFGRPWLSTVLTTWEPLPPQAVWFWRLIDLTPQGQTQQSWDTFYGILATWNPDPPVSQRRTVVLASGPDVIVPNPAFSRTWLDPVLHSWDESNPIRPRLPVVTASGPDVTVPNPAMTRPWLDPILHSWDEQNPIRPRLPVVTPSGPDVIYPNPAFTRPWLDVILHSWDEQNPIRPRPPVVTASGPDVPVIPPATINYQADGPRKKKKKSLEARQTDVLFAAIEQTIRDTMAGKTAVPATAPAQPVVDVSKGYRAALEQLFVASRNRQDLSIRVAQLQREVEAHQRKLLEEDEDDWMRL